MFVTYETIIAIGVERKPPFLLDNFLYIVTVGRCLSSYVQLLLREPE